MPKKLWLISRNDSMYDEWDAFVIRAKSAQEARRIASLFCTKYGVHSFKSSEHSQCAAIKLEGESEVILGSFNAG